MKTAVSYLFAGIAALALAGCAPSAQQMKKLLEDNPDILTSAFEKNPDKILESLNKASRDAREKMAAHQEQDRAKALEDEFKNPKKPEIDDSRALFGPKDAKVTIVEYSDFQCPYCKNGYKVMNEVKAKYGDKVRLVFKHLPLEFHPKALPAAKYFEAVEMQGMDKAAKFYDKVFENQDKLTSQGDKYLDVAVKEVGANLAKVKKDLESPKIMERINADKAEAGKFEFSGTPGFLVNGISVKGAYPLPEFEKIIDRCLK